MPSPAPLMSRAHARRDLVIDQSPGGLTNQAPAATPFASSFGIYNGTATSAAGLNDGTNTPWVSNSGGAGQWVELEFPNALHMNIIYLYDRGNPNDQVASGTLTFDDGTVISTGPLNNDGSATAIIFPTILASKIVFAITGVSATTTAVGLTEFQVCYDQKCAPSESFPPYDARTDNMWRLGALPR
ncbi:hypothetical protein FIBSPDRAFT_166797 [Athelia psychrophila]|uniref:DUF7402 domain-containing protein n=1 Tax=Athelia psychrophila TaxID=1759441 RepID=A0A166B1K7_9AGAM|nr:hypothetical protein FIBSPDRAFT_166797 [Fibularhizoctonia sp. CBS 109695]